MPPRAPPSPGRRWDHRLIGIDAPIRQRWSLAAALGAIRRVFVPRVLIGPDDAGAGLTFVSAGLVFDAALFPGLGDGIQRRRRVGAAVPSA
ncbi:hypothetical protein [Xanthomonas sp. XNM01]|uniref:hypothetical protein n=1 Tax=Xanthomonas sp. XNM01 TaxID=2769289 RepID=UPI00178644D3|nr:hypothetical protein [Xanthomonas sp. XNM01]MBD9368661.1 hypothetical protein [Xanthomonas sp. XNM01]